MGIGVRRLEPLGEHEVNLRAEFGFDLLGGCLAIGEFLCDLRGRQKVSVGIHKGGHGMRGQYGLALAKIQMNTDVESRNVAKARNRIIAGRLIDHE
jgi:hypothetical protein